MSFKFDFPCCKTLNQSKATLSLGNFLFRRKIYWKKSICNMKYSNFNVTQAHVYVESWIYLKNLIASNQIFLITRGKMAVDWNTFTFQNILNQDHALPPTNHHSEFNNSDFFVRHTIFTNPFRFLVYFLLKHNRNNIYKWK